MCMCGSPKCSWWIERKERPHMNAWFFISWFVRRSFLSESHRSKGTHTRHIIPLEGKYDDTFLLCSRNERTIGRRFLLVGLFLSPFVSDLSTSKFRDSCRMCKLLRHFQNIVSRTSYPYLCVGPSGWWGTRHIMFSRKARWSSTLSPNGWAPPMLAFFTTCVFVYIHV